jgi:hypothetical protein
MVSIRRHITACHCAALRTLRGMAESVVNRWPRGLHG